MRRNSSPNNPRTPHNPLEVTMLAQVFSGALDGVRCVPVRVEVSITSGIPTFSVVGLPQSAVREGKDRVWSALANSGLQPPAGKITVNLAPADLKKEGSGFDLPLALGLLAGDDRLPPERLEPAAFAGELGLDGTLRPIRGVLALARGFEEAGVRELFLPAANAAEAAAGAPELRVFGADTLRGVVDHLLRREPLHPTRVQVGELLRAAAGGGGDLAEVRGHVAAKRALEVAAAGGHNLLMVGPPGGGKTMLARRLPGILPTPTPAEALEATTLHSVAGLLPPGEAILTARPFRAPHHSTSTAGLVGGGAPIRPGEVSLAHRGVLFLDELPEFSRSALEALRQPIEDGWVSVVRARDRARFPARFTLVAAMNPCPCGTLGDPRRPCLCDPAQVARYRARISGPLRDRIDLQIEVSPVPFRELTGAPAEGESSRVVRSRVEAARARQLGRNRAGEEREGAENALLGPRELRRWATPDRAGHRLLEQASRRMALSSRGIHRVLRVARTLADLEGEEGVEKRHLAEAIQYRLSPLRTEEVG